MTIPPDDGDELFRTVRPSEPPWPPVLDDARGWAGGVEGYGGLVGVFGSDTREAFAVAGGLIRIRYRYYQLGGYYEASDRVAGDGFQSFGGFAGAFLPYLGWLDIELAAGFGARLYENSSARFGEGGYQVTLPSLSVRSGVSDRTGLGTFAGRVGGFVVVAYDLGNEDIPWQTESLTQGGEVIRRSGVSNVGGFSASLYLTLGFDIGPDPVTQNRAASIRSE